MWVGRGVKVGFDVVVGSRPRLLSRLPAIQVQQWIIQVSRAIITQLQQPVATKPAGQTGDAPCQLEKFKLPVKSKNLISLAPPCVSIWKTLGLGVL